VILDPELALVHPPELYRTEVYVPQSIVHFFETWSEALNPSGGREVKHTGDGIMASFASAAGAVRCAARIQRELARYWQENTEHPIKVRIGAAAGEPVEHQQDLFGSTVQLAARLCSEAQPEQILVSSVIAELCLGKCLLFQDLGEVSLRGFERPMRVHAVDWPGDAG